MSIVNQKELADIIGKSTRQIQRMTKDGIPIHSSSSKQTHYDSTLVIQWLIDREIQKLTKEGDYDSEEERARLLHHQANLAELKEEEERNRLVPADQVDRLWGSLLLTFRTRMLQVPKSVVTRIIGETDEQKVVAELTDEIKQGLEVLSSSEQEIIDNT
ncbi:terminase small subunit [Endozoicomonas euniceicola]|uniref:Terminase small subunit n=1 Tax=Endozoicomonas euniceicola TaxID=1234143 RepID=A0ABY6GQI6_9GAMM|nr:terminase small subunit [Endozoicomonas euniceicola]UYM14269.1 terminase small subunit [Endozoicomonas euniceicola]